MTRKNDFFPNRSRMPNLLRRSSFFLSKLSSPRKERCGRLEWLRY